MMKQIIIFNNQKTRKMKAKLDYKRQTIKAHIGSLERVYIKNSEEKFRDFMKRINKHLESEFNESFYIDYDIQKYEPVIKTFQTSTEYNRQIVFPQIIVTLFQLGNEINAYINYIILGLGTDEISSREYISRNHLSLKKIAETFALQMSDKVIF